MLDIEALAPIGNLPQAQSMRAAGARVADLPQADGRTHSACSVDLERVAKRISHVV